MAVLPRPAAGDVRRAYRTIDNAEPQPASARWAMRSLHAAGRDAAEVERAMLALDVRPVLTAHPTESTRRTLLALQARVADLLLAREGTPIAERRAIEEELDGEVELLWVTAEVRQDRPSVSDEVSTVLWYLETRLLDAEARARDALVRAFEEEFGTTSDAVRQIVPLRIGNWVGGDRDGNPFVTPDVTIATARRARATRSSAATSSRSPVSSSGCRVSASVAARRTSCARRSRSDRALLPDVYEANRRRNADEPLRLKLTLMAARVEATRRLTAARDAGRVADEPAAYATPRARAATCCSCADSLRSRRRGARLPHDDRSAGRRRARARDSRIPDGRPRPRRRASRGARRRGGAARRRAVQRQGAAEGARWATSIGEHATGARRRHDARARHLPRRAHDSGRDGRGRGEHVHRLDDHGAGRPAARAAPRARSRPRRSRRRSAQSRLDVVPLFETLDDLERAPDRDARVARRSGLPPSARRARQPAGSDDRLLRLREGRRHSSRRRGRCIRDRRRSPPCFATREWSCGSFTDAAAAWAAAAARRSRARWRRCRPAR